MKKWIHRTLPLAFFFLACSGGGGAAPMDTSDTSLTPDLVDTISDAGSAEDMAQDTEDGGVDAIQDLVQDAGQPLDTSPADAASDVVSDPFAGVGAIIEQKMAEGKIPGLAVAVTLPGEVVWTGVYGKADVAANLPVTKDTPFMLASVSKTVTGVAVMRAKEQGKLGLDDEINALLPFMVDNPLVDGEVITVRHLVSHTSGIRDNWSQMPYIDGDPTISLGDYLEGYLVEGGASYNVNKNFNATLPGTAFDYGNIATALAGFVVEVVTQTPFNTYCEEEIFDVLNMDNTGWYLADFDASLVAMPHKVEDGNYVALGHYGYADYPDGQLRTSILDIARFLAAMSNDGALEDARVLEESTAAQMFSVQMPEVKGTQFVFWYQSNIAGRTVIGHNGGDKGVATQISFSPETGVGVIILMNTSWSETLTPAAGAIQELLYDVAEGL